MKHAILAVLGLAAGYALALIVLAVLQHFLGTTRLI